MVKLWDLTSSENAKSVLGRHRDAIQRLAFYPAGTLLVTNSRHRKIELFDPRMGGDAVRVPEVHGGAKVRLSTLIVPFFSIPPHTPHTIRRESSLHRLPRQNSHNRD